MHLFDQLTTTESITILAYALVLLLLGTLIGYLLRSGSARRLKATQQVQAQELQQLKPALAQAEQQLAVQEAEQKRLRLELADTQTRNKALTLEKNNLDTRINRLTSIKQAHDTLTQAHNALTQSHAQLQTELDEKTQDNSHLSATAQTLQEELQQLEQQLEAEKAAHLDTINKLEQQVTAEQTLATERQAEQAQRISQLEQQLKAFKAGNMGAYLQQQQARGIAHNDSTDHFHTQITQLEQAVIQQEQALLTERQSWKQEKAQLQQALQQAQQVAEALHQKAAAEQTKLKTQLVQWRTQSENIDAIRAEADKHKQAFHNLLLRQNELILRIEQLKEEVQALQREKENGFSAASADAIDETHVQALQQELSKVKGQLSTWEAEQQQLRSHLDTYQTQVKQLEEEKYLLQADMEEQVAAAQASSRSIAQQKDSQAQALDALRQQLEAEREKHDAIQLAADREKHDLRVHINALEASLEQYRLGKMNRSSGTNDNTAQLQATAQKAAQKAAQERAQLIAEIQELRTQQEERLTMERQKLTFVEEENQRLIDRIQQLEAQKNDIALSRGLADTEIETLHQDLNKQARYLSQQLAHIKDENMRLNSQITQLQDALLHQNISQDLLEGEIATLTTDHELALQAVYTRINHLQDENMQLKQQLTQFND